MNNSKSQNNDKFMFQSHKMCYDTLQNMDEIESIYIKIIKNERHMPRMLDNVAFQIAKFSIDLLKFLNNYSDESKTQSIFYSSFILNSLNDIVYFIRDLDFLEYSFY